MNDKFGGHRPRSAWPGRMGVLVVTAGVALLAAACSGGGSPSSTSTATAGTSAAYTKALAYAKCIRSHGIPDFPDPNSKGQFVVQNGSGTQQQQALSHLVQYAQCMRAHGVPNFPDLWQRRDGI
jgi:hypothetical protein